ncbi:MAG: hypothetical protein BWY25_01267 [Chloroflexi bacterium ADurb.Bin222]|nr:MAG: hypothetical protein BWY25_01267 [Chloroflexi bacterium ADurb.Bin222]
MRKVIGLIVVMALLLGWGAPAQAAEYPQLERALAWLLTNQQQDGGFTSGFSAGSDLGATTEVVLAFAAAGERFEDPSPLAYLEAQVQAGAVTDAASLSRAVMLARALGADPRAIGGKDLVKALLATQDKTTGRFGESLYAHAYALLALHNAGEPLPETAVTLLLEEQQDNGSWAMLGGEEAADTNTTSLAAQALVAAGETAAAQKALGYFEVAQNDDGGFPWQKPSPYGTDTDANSTALVLQALVALGEDPAAWAPQGASPVDALLALWDAESGGYNWQLAMPGANVLATAQAVQALSGMTLVDLAAPGPVLISSAALAVESAPEAAPVPLLPTSGGPAIEVGYLLVLAGAALLGSGLLLRRDSYRKL